MIVYVESNFILEMVLRQREAGSAERILELAEHGKIELAFPSFALCEPFWIITRRERDQGRLSKLLEGMIDQLPTLLANAAKKVVNKVKSEQVLRSRVSTWREE